MKNLARPMRGIGGLDWRWRCARNEKKREEGQRGAQFALAYRCLGCRAGVSGAALGRERRP